VLRRRLDHGQGRVDLDEPDGETDGQRDRRGDGRDGREGSPLEAGGRRPRLAGREPTQELRVFDSSLGGDAHGRPAERELRERSFEPALEGQGERGRAASLVGECQQCR
jgi:hypothetical protein